MYKTMKIYYDNTTGDVLWTNSYSYYLEPSLDRDYEKLRALNQYEKSVISLLVLHDGQYAQDFKEGRLVGVNLETKEPIFEYPNPENPTEPIITEKPLSEDINILKEDVNVVAELTAITVMDKEEIAEMLSYALIRIDELESKIEKLENPSPL